jgi:hypothetical protein
MMCEQEVAFNALLKSGAFKRLPKAYQTMFEAQCKDAKKSAGVQMELGQRMVKVEADIQEIKRTMVTKDDLREQFQLLRENLSSDMKKSAKFDFVQDILQSWKFWSLVLIFIGVLLGRGYLEYLTAFIK